VAAAPIVAVVDETGGRMTTPNIDGLAARGVRFTRAYVAA
jgi:arylsulfatase A-like enzyme